MTEKELIDLLEVHDELLVRWADGHLTFPEFLAQYDNFSHVYALDGHEADSSELILLEKHHQRVAVHLEVSELLSRLCSEEDWGNPSYRTGGRAPPAQVMAELKDFVAKTFKSEAS